MNDDEMETLPEQVRLDAALARTTELDRKMAEAAIRRGEFGTPLAEVFAELEADDNEALPPEFLIEDDAGNLHAPPPPDDFIRPPT